MLAYTKKKGDYMAKFEEPVQEEVEFNDVEELGQEEQQELHAETAVEEKPKSKGILSGIKSLFSKK